MLKRKLLTINSDREIVDNRQSGASDLMLAARRKLPRDVASGPEAEQRVVSAILQAILDQKLGPGARLVERELALSSGASRSAIRNGLLRLAQSGLVELNPNKGATIATCGPREAREIFDARVVIESSLIATLSEKATENDIARLDAFVEDERQAYAAGRMQDARYLSRGFHLLIADLAGNRVLASFLRELINKQPLLSWSGNRSKSCFCGNQAHSEIVRAIAAGDASAAAALNVEHLRELERQLIADRGKALGVEQPSSGEAKAIAERPPKRARALSTKGAFDWRAKRDAAGVLAGKTRGAR